MPVPKASVDEYREPEAGEYEVRATGEIAAVER